MRELVAYVMRSPSRAGIAASISAMIPFMFWFSAALVALVTLRHGAAKGVALLVWAGIPAVFWLANGDPGVLIVVTLAFALSVTLRMAVSLEAAMFTGVLVSLACGGLIPMLMPELMDGLMEVAESMYKQLIEDSGTEYTAETSASLKALMIASFAGTYFCLGILSLFLARSWQAHLYNPGGWREEFHDFRLSSKFLLGLLVVFLVTPVLGVDPALVSLVSLVPFFIAGIALVHGVIGKKKLGGQWLVIFYMSLVLLGPTALFMLIIAALLDSGLNFRQRITV